MAESRLRIVRFAVAHLSGIRAQAFAEAGVEILGDPRERVAAYANAGPVWTGLRGREVLFCMGAVRLWSGVADAWALIAPDALRLPVSLHRATARLLADEQAANGCRRLQASVRADHAAAARWIARLGFAYEGRMPGFGPDGADHLRFARVLDRDAKPQPALVEPPLAAAA